MPYIKKEDRDKFSAILRVLPSSKTPGELNYLITKIVHLYIKDNGVSYKIYNEVMGVLSCAQQELYRREISKYEDRKIEENGDI